ncbi:MAG: arylsulfatase [Candidatus Rokubacteria bacterium]|nr:arylsulfatase [Candidatus Rokubacteria bacterium]
MDNDLDFRGALGRTWRESTPWWPEPVRPPAGAPNIVVIVLDDVGFADLGCYGSEIATPAMDRLAAGGLRYNNFHVTAMCSPTRACLLTGRNAHAVGMGIIAEWSTGFPGYRGRITPRAATLPEILREHAYATLGVGKWHLTPLAEATAAGPFGDWPLARGFDRWYGFHGALTDQWNPELFEDQHAIDVPREGYHLSQDLVDRAIAFVRDQQSVAPERPFFLYVAFGACHWPHHAPQPYLEKYRGRYDEGWDAVREARLARQKTFGIVPPSTELAPRNPGVAAWAALSADERRVFARLQEAYAAFLEHTDVQIGRLLASLGSIGRLDDTLVVLLSDNGASPEGGATGALNERKHLAYEPDTVAEALAGMDLIGTEHAFNHYPTGWAQVSNTPLKWYKKDAHGGGIRAPLVVQWPARLRDRERVRTQYHHVIDIVPTVLEVAGIEAPAVFRGVPQLPIHGVSLAYTFDGAEVPARKVTQHYEILGDRALWHRGWKAVARHDKGADFERDRWELYHTDEDFAECHDLADQHPERLRELVDRWWAEAGAHQVLPLDDREYERVADAVRARARARYVYYPGMARIDRLSAPEITDRSWSVAADVEIPEDGAEGVILAAGTRFAGYVLYVRDGRFVWEYAYSPTVRHVIRSEARVPTGRVELRWEFTRTGSRRGRGALFVDGKLAGTTEIPKTWPIHGTTGGVHCGRDGGAPVSEAYTPPFTFTGTIHRLVVELARDGEGASSGSPEGRAGAARHALEED